MAVLGAAYVYGYRSAERDVTSLHLTIQALEDANRRLRQANEELKDVAASASASEQEWRDRYEADVPKGRALELFGDVRKALEQGVEPARLSTLISSSADESMCATESETKRFLGRTPIYQGANDAVRFAEGAIVITAEGQSATDAAGNPEAWVDPALPVTVRFTKPGGATNEVTGLLPLYGSVVANGAEYRFTVADSPRRGFLEATALRCEIADNR